MIKFYGIFQLVKVVKIGETKKKDLMIYFTAASNRSEGVSDFKLFKVFGKNAEKFINNLEKKGDGYKSRRMMIEGYVETYNDDKVVKCSASVKKEKLPEKYGKLIKDFKVETNAIVTIQRDAYSVTQFQFLDKKSDGSTKFIDNGEEEEETIICDDDEETEEKALMESVSSKSLTKNDIGDIVKSGEDKLGSFKRLIV